jgi:hypothetical protein
MTMTKIYPYIPDIIGMLCLCILSGYGFANGNKLLDKIKIEDADLYKYFYNGNVFTGYYSIRLMLFVMSYKNEVKYKLSSDTIILIIRQRKLLYCFIAIFICMAAIGAFTL